MGVFTDRVWVDYPIPYSVSIWGSSQVDTETDIQKLISACVDELASTNDITEGVRGTGTTVHLPSTARDIISVTLDHPFQGNKYVKWTFDNINSILYTRFTPVLIKYRRALTVADLDTLTGNRLKYARAYILHKMAVKELTIISAIKLDTDNGELNLDALRDFITSCKTTLDELKEELIYYVPSR